MLTRIEHPFLNDAGHRGEPSDHRRSPTSLTHDDDVGPLAFVPADADRLELTLSLHRVGEALQSLGLELLTRLRGVRLDLLDGHLDRVLTLRHSQESRWHALSMIERHPWRGLARVIPYPETGVHVRLVLHQFVELSHHATPLSRPAAWDATRTSISSATALIALAAALFGL